MVKTTNEIFKESLDKKEMNKLWYSEEEYNKLKEENEKIKVENKTWNFEFNKLKNKIRKLKQEIKDDNKFIGSLNN